MDGHKKLTKEERRKQIVDVLRAHPALTDEELADSFGVSVATIRLDRQTLGIPQKRERVEKAAADHLRKDEIEVLDVEPGKKGVALFHTTEEMADAKGLIPAEYFYGAATEFAQALIGETFTPAQVGNVKYKSAVGPGEQLVMKGKVALMRGNKKYIYINFNRGAAEVFRAKFIMEVSRG